MVGRSVYGEEIENTVRRNVCGDGKNDGVMNARIRTIQKEKRNAGIEGHVIHVHHEGGTRKPMSAYVCGKNREKLR